ncbi:S-layer homology domain-containing protein [Sporosarcina sp. G11-34]|uniref:S-layer homology domain-containing protein n=1 Tax=Sporosarcina sp. G11-34 TaxID=2849605 RepID=UPI0022A93610|nr:S-layer homology domain-containing protein [Sporosarcina sp. G11-34]
MKFMIGVMIVSLSMLVGPIVNAFSDVPPSHTFRKEIDHLVSLGAISGFSNGTFQSNANVTRGQAAKIITVALDMPLVSPTTPTFTDVSKSHTFYRHIETLAAKGIIGGHLDGSFKPGSSLKRSEMARIIAGSFDLTEVSPVRFKDVSDSSWYSLYVNQLATSRITVGYQDGTFRPDGIVSRGQIAAFVSRGIGNDETENFYYRHVHFGMSRAEVKAAEGLPTTEDIFEMKYRNIEHGPFMATITYSFTKDKLEAIYLEFDVRDKKHSESEQLFNHLVVDMYEPQFGRAYDSQMRWKDNSGYDILYADWLTDQGIRVSLQLSTGYGLSSIHLSLSLFR